MPHLPKQILLLLLAKTLHVLLVRINLLYWVMPKLNILQQKENLHLEMSISNPFFSGKYQINFLQKQKLKLKPGTASADLGLEYANMCYMVNPYLILHAGRFLPKFGAYRGRAGEAFLNRFASDPTGFGDGGIGAMNETGIGAQGGLPFGDIKINYDFYISNGPQLLTDPDNAGQFEYEAYTSNNKSSAIGGRVAILPFQNSSLEIGYSFQSKSKTGEVGTAYQNTGVVMQAVDLNYLPS